MLSWKCIFESFRRHVYCWQRAILSLIQVPEVEGHPVLIYYEAILIKDGCRSSLNYAFRRSIIGTCIDPSYFCHFRLLEDTLNFMTKVAQHSERARHDASGKFWKAMLHKTYEIVDKVSHIVSFVNFPKWTFLNISSVLQQGCMPKLAQFVDIWRRGPPHMSVFKK